MSKESLLSVCDEVEKVIKDIESEAQVDSTLAELVALADSIRTQELLVPLIGGFSSGKSSTINRFLGENILSVKITPETAIATELRFSENPRLEAFKEDGSFDTFASFEEIANIQNYSFVRLYLNNIKIQSIEPFILVDMPGFNAPIATHNKAIMRYIPNGVHFIALVATDGEVVLTREYINQLDSIYNQNKRFSFCLSKTDLRPQSTNDEIAASMKEQLQSYYDYHDEITLLSLKDNGGLESVIRKINQDEIFSRIYTPSVKITLQNFQHGLNNAISGLRYSKEEAKESLSTLDNDLIKIEQEKESTIAQIQNRYSNRSVENILNTLRNKLNADVEYLAGAVMRGDFERELNSIINAFLPSEVDKQLNEVSKNVIEGFKVQITNIGINTESIVTWADGLKPVVDSLCYMASNALKNGIATAATGAAAGISAATATSSMFGKFGLGTLALNPLVGMVVSAVLGILPGIFSQFADKKKKEAVKEKLTNEAIPSIISHIRPQIAEFFQAKITEIIDGVAQAFSEKISQTKTQIKAAQQAKTNELGAIEEDIAKLESARDAIKTLQNTLS